MSYAPFTVGFWLSVCIAKVIGYSRSLGLLNAKGAFEGLEPCDGKLSCTGSEGTEWQQCHSVTRLSVGRWEAQYIVCGI